MTTALLWNVTTAELPDHRPRWEHTTAVIIPLPRQPRYVGCHRHDETVETWKYVAVFGTGGFLWLSTLIGGWLLATGGWN